MKGIIAADISISGLPLHPDTLRQQLGGRSDRASRLAGMLNGETAAYAALSVGDLLYDSFRIDPLAVEGIDFARAADLSDILRLANFAEGLEKASGSVLAGHVAQLHGYVAERVAAHALLATGAEVSFPATSNQPGWDLLVNGQPFQVKCMAAPAGVHKHLALWPDIPVIANSELAPYFAGDGRVTTLGGFSHEDVLAITKDTLSGAADLLDLQIPLISTAVASARAGLAVIMDETDLLTALKAASIGSPEELAAPKSGAVAAAAGLGLAGGLVAG